MQQAIDKQIEDFLPLLDNEEKKSILSVIRSFMNLRKQLPDRISLEQYNKEQDEALKRVKSGHYVIQEEIEKHSKEWRSI